ncbi:hypothetical protein EG834_16265 [bacterium]|nr:hypothetical protein [bacterium]
MMKKIIFVLLIGALLAGCATKPVGPQTLTVMTHDSFAISEGLVTQFESENNVKLVFLKGGDAGSALNRAILTKGSPEAGGFDGWGKTF